VLSYKTILYFQNVSFKQKLKPLKRAADIEHFIIIPNYKEPLHKLEKTIERITQSDYPHKTIHLVLAFERREEEGPEKAAYLSKKFGHFFKDIFTTYHVLVAGEVPGKASNQTHAAKVLSSYIRDQGMELDNVIITIADADSLFPPNYFSYLTYEFLKDEGRDYHFYWAPVLEYNNFWQLPFFVRMQATLSSIFRLAFLSQRQKLIQISTYSTPLSLLEKIGYWDVDIIPEDWHVHFQAFFKFGSKVKTIPLFTIVGADAVYSGAIIKTLVNRYEQEKRWAWGVSDIGYALKQSVVSPHISAMTKINKMANLVETHLLWPTSFFILTVSALIPPLINPVFKRTVLGFLLPQLSSLILTLSTLFLLGYSYLDVKLRNRMDQRTKYYILPFLLIQWYLLPVVSFVLSSLPALDAHTRMIIGKKLEYKVTEKV
jgi:cellulose synthase/poly-beta-1,6-N-acetylglucosamine synthase-like glycosyltransferase